MINTKYRIRTSEITINIVRSGEDVFDFTEGMLTGMFDPEPAIGGFNSPHLPSYVFHVTILQPRIP